MVRFARLQETYQLDEERLVAASGTKVLDLAFSNTSGSPITVTVSGQGNDVDVFNVQVDANAYVHATNQPFFAKEGLLVPAAGSDIHVNILKELGR